MSLAAELDIGDQRIEFIADYVLKTMKFKGDKWTKMYSVDENKQMFMEFVDKQDILYLLVEVVGGNLSVTLTWPQSLKGKACYFIKKRAEALPKDAALRNKTFYGDLCYTPVDQLSSFVDEVGTDNK